MALGEKDAERFPRTQVGRRVEIARLNWQLARKKKLVYPLSTPHMGRPEFRSVYTGVGAALVVAGFAVMANWVSIVQAASQPNALRVAGSMFYVGIAVVATGAYCFVASMSNRSWLWLPGKGPMIRAAEAEGLRDEFHSVALGTLAFARIAGLTLKQMADPSVQQVRDWYARVLGACVRVWGHAGSNVLSVLVIDESRSWEKNDLISEIVDPTLLNIEATMARVSSKEIRDGLDRNDLASLKADFDFFSSGWEHLLDPSPTAAQDGEG